MVQYRLFWRALNHVNYSICACLMLLPKSSSRQCHERMVVMSLVMVLAVLSQESSAQSGATVSSEYGDTKGDLLSITVIAVAAGAIVVVILCVLVFFIAITTAVIVKRRRGSYSLPTENEYAGEQQPPPSTDANITPPLPPRTAEMFQMIEHHHSPSLSSRKSPPLPPRTAEMFELIDNFSPPSSDMSSIINNEKENASEKDSQNQDDIVSNTAVGVSVIQNEECSAPPIPPRPSSSNDHSYYNMSAVIAAVNPMLLGETPIPPRPSRSTPPPPLPPKPTKQSHSQLRPPISSKSNTSPPVDTQTKTESSLDELPESDRQCLPMVDEKLNYEPNRDDVSCDIAMTSEESLDMWPPTVPRQTEDVFFVAVRVVQNDETRHCAHEELHTSSNINLKDNVAYKIVS